MVHESSSTQSARLLFMNRSFTGSGCRTDVDQVALAVQHDVAVVSVFDLQQEQQEAVGGHAADEVVPSL